MSDPAPDALLRFPCDFPVKVMGRATPGFAARVADVVRRHAPDLREDAVSVRDSSAGRYVAVTVVVRAQSREQLDAIYRDLTACPDALMCL